MAEKVEEGNGGGGHTEKRDSRARTQLITNVLWIMYVYMLCMLCMLCVLCVYSCAIIRRGPMCITAWMWSWRRTTAAVSAPMSAKQRPPH